VQKKAYLIKQIVEISLTFGHITRKINSHMKQNFTLSFLNLRFIVLPLITIVISPVLNAQNFVFSKTISGKEVIFTANWDFSAIMQLTNPDENCIDPRISPDGKHIVFLKGEKATGMDLWLMKTNGTDAKRLTYDFINSVSHPSWHPNGKQILYESGITADKYESVIRIININGSDDRILFNNANDKDRYPLMNPADINKVVYHYDPDNWEFFSQIRIRNLSSGTDEILVDNNGWADGFFSFSADGNMLLWSETENGDEMRLRTINLKTRSINTINTVRGPCRNISGAFDQTGKCIFYVRRSSSPATEVVRCNADGSSPAVLYTADSINRLAVIPGIPVALYIFDGNTSDISSYGNNATANEAMLTYNRCLKTDNAYHFNGSNSFISVPHNEVFNFGTGDFSILAFISTPVVFSDRSAVVSNHNTSAYSDNEFFLGIDGTGIPFFELSTRDGIIERVNGSASICDNNYHSICGVRENGIIKLYVDTMLLGTDSSTINLNNSNPLNFGGSNYGNGSGYLYGNIDDIRIYSRALSTVEINSIFDECHPPEVFETYTPCYDCDLTVEWITPVEKPPCGTTRPSVKVRIKNIGQGDAKDFMVSYSLDNGISFVSEGVDLNLSPGSSIDYTFRQPADMSVIKTYSCLALVRKPGDTIRNNDTAYIQVINNRRELTIETAETVCAQATGGAVITGITNGIPPYSYSWSSGSATERADNLAVGIYKVKVTDYKGCTAALSFTIDEIGAPKITSNVSIKNNSCFGIPDGSIGITVIGGNIPYSYEWSNGMITEDINGLVPGHYEVIVTDKTGCKKFAGYDVFQPAPLYLSISSTNTSGTTDDGTAEVSVYGGTPPYEYIWSTDSTGSLQSNLESGIYQAVITDANGCRDSVRAAIFQLCGPDIVVNSVTPSECGLRNGSVDISIPGEDGPFEYLWSNNDTVQDIAGVPSGDYTVTVAYKDSACASVAEITVPALLDPVPICMVSVDTMTGHNMVIWQKPVSTGNISAFNIYRETDRYEVYELIGTRTINDESFYIDDDSIVNPAIQPWKYKMSVTDTCGNESDLSAVHKTMHLLMNEGLGNTVNLIWDNYSGFDYYTCHVFRYSTQSGLQNIFNKAGSPQLIFNSFTDLTPPESGYYYFIEIESPYTCTSRKKATSHNSVRSNKTNKISSTGIISEFPANLRNLSLYPNPNNGIFTIYLELEKQNDIIIRIYDSYGRLLIDRKSYNIAGEYEENVNFSDRTPGIYYLKVIIKEGVIIKPFVIE
jgi:Tol biopolymer transport system component